MPKLETALISATGTRERLIDAISALVAERGLEGTSIRAINKEACVANQSAVNYHFGNVWGLVEAAVARATDAYSGAIQSMLDEQKATGLPVTLMDVAESMIRPIVRMVATPAGRNNVQLMARMAGDCGQRGRELLARGLGPVSLILSAHACEAMPALSKEAAGVKILYAFNTVLNVIPDAGLERWWPLETTSRDRLDRYLRDYIVGGIAFSSRPGP
ncbi:TetR/AcrR family transcriptional regulator [Silvimonas amylolytica]|uniref:TetR family transcriptional regulator n=1 Tax=Silvimonas amylolytica TaxID=449663 RepID=A0ABQ2PNG8_9NEIS|nr:TetR/AcrR family transcriptional regulator [Silvimonas amylolytica]GGP26751.1 TetR family transcriptional regulator [Silvimonas amylolytica]